MLARLRPALAVVLFLQATITFAQPAPLKWGEVPSEQLAMTAYAPDTSAHAVILADYATVTFDRDWDTEITRHRQVKLLTPAAYEDWGTVSILYLRKGRTQDVKGLRAQTITRGPDGKPVFHPLDKKSIFNVDVDGNWRAVKFTMPSLEPGAIVEYSYTLKTKGTFIPPWFFQASVPTLWSEYRPILPGRLTFAVRRRGLKDFDLMEEADASGSFGRGTQLRMVMKDVPALREESYSTSLTDYFSRVDFTFVGTQGAEAAERNVIAQWFGLAEYLMADFDFGGELGKGRVMQKRVDEVVAGATDDEAKVRAITEHLRANFKWNGFEGKFLSGALKDVMRSGEGSRGEANLLLVGMLRDAGFEADPVLISTRDNGKATDEFALLDQFNSVLAQVKVGPKSQLLDATDPLRPYSLLPAEAVNGSGWVVRKGNPQWIRIQTTGRLKRQTLLIASLDSAGTLTGTLDQSNAEYAALEARHARKDAESDSAYVREHVIEGFEDVLLDSVRFSRVDDVFEPLGLKAGLTLTDYAQAAGDFIYFNPVVLERLPGNPFKSAERSYPVDYNYPHDIGYAARLRIPEGYSVQEMPKNLILREASGGASFERKVQLEDGTIVLTTRLSIREPVFEPEHYQGLRRFYDEVVAAQAEQVVLSRFRSESAAQAAGE